ncbi:MAG: transposase [Methylococcales bacterium]|nr:transposase [Methylococcales bacterium]
MEKRQRALVLWFPDGLDRTSGQAKGMKFYFLPPYSPELNRIELLWRKMKYEWLPFKTFTPDELEQAIDEIGSGFGSKYTLTFC